jgi:hypothetical protein
MVFNFFTSETDETDETPKVSLKNFFRISKKRGGGIK